jgi:hypothetical protein
LAGNLVKPLSSLYGTEWRERGYGLRDEGIKVVHIPSILPMKVKSSLIRINIYFQEHSDFSFLTVPVRDRTVNKQMQK